VIKYLPYAILAVLCLVSIGSRLCLILR